ncbi:MAG: c-type cytochrome [Bacteroidales bacterium]|nr:c-type cytochrome [Bacteroidales bacterium]MCF8458750.1 c-type cytochrome [Bacteroidales bacterium]
MEKDDKKVKYDGKPMEHEFDGIKELNNPIPPWLQVLFFITVAFSLFYWLYYHVWTGDLQEQEYQKEMAAAEVKLEKHRAETKQLDIILLTDDASITAGEAIFKEKLCATCHGQLGEGNPIGPNLTDKYWINGGTIEQVFATIKNGVPTKGMTPFKDQLPDEKILQVSSYVLHKLQGTNPPNAKEPQGVLVE